MNLRTKSQKGFTIVELLIVIVVIAILAAISIVAYTGVQNNARNTARAADAKVVVDAINAYYADKGVWPGATLGAAPADTFHGAVQRDLATFTTVTTSDAVRGRITGAAPDAANPDRIQVTRLNTSSEISGVRVSYFKIGESTPLTYTAGSGSGS